MIGTGPDALINWRFPPLRPLATPGMRCRCNRGGHWVVVLLGVAVRRGAQGQTGRK